MPAGFDWDKHPLTTQRLVKLWESEGSSTLIAKMLSEEFSELYGVDFTKNMVIGRAHRLKLPPKKTKLDPMPKKIHSPTAPKPPKMKVDIQLDEPVPVVPVGEFAGHRQCRFIHGDPAKTDWVMCGAPTELEKSYCAYHLTLVYDQKATEAVKKRDHGR